MTYEYVCAVCHHEWEAEQSISAPPIKTCPNCNSDAAKRQISGGAGFILKGGGWYADGYGSSSSSSSSSVTSESAETKKTETPKTDSTPEKKTTPTTTDSPTKSEKSSEKKSGASAAA